MIASLNDLFATTQTWLFETVVLPLIHWGGLGEFTDDAYNGTEWLLIGLVELALIYAILRPLEALIPVHPITDPRARRLDFLYTVIHRLGLFSIAIFFLLDPLIDQANSILHLQGIRPFDLENLWPGVTDHALVSFFVYLLVLDFFEYWFHRGEHHFSWWWGLHAVHHSQQNMNLWTDDRNHLLDDLLRDIYLALIAMAIGVQPSQYVLIIAASRALQSLQHANVRIHFGRIGERLLVSPRYHRTHHGIGIGHESGGKGTLGGHNFAVLFPIWDILFGTAHFSQEYAHTGIRDQQPPPAGIARDYGSGFWAQQWLGLKHMVSWFGKDVP